MTIIRVGQDKSPDVDCVLRTFAFPYLEPRDYEGDQGINLEQAALHKWNSVAMESM
jgi:hypothetical protein